MMMMIIKISKLNKVAENSKHHNSCIYIYIYIYRGSTHKIILQYFTTAVTCHYEMISKQCVMTTINTMDIICSNDVEFMVTCRRRRTVGISPCSRSPDLHTSLC